MFINSAKELGALVRSERKKRQWSQRELAETVGVSPLWISNFERGKSSAQIGLVLRTLKAMDVKLRVGEPPKHPLTTATANLNSLFSDLHKATMVPEVSDELNEKPSTKKPHE